MPDPDTPSPTYNLRSWARGAEERWAQEDGDDTMGSGRGRTRSAILAGAVSALLFALGAAAAYVARPEVARQHVLEQRAAQR